MEQKLLLSTPNPNNLKSAIILILVLILIAGGYFGYQKFQEMNRKIEELKKEIEKLEPKEEILEPAPIEEQEIGQKAEGLMIKAIRTGDHQKFFRIVFDIRKTDLTDSELIPLSRASYWPDKLAIEIKISGIENPLDSPAIGESIKIGDLVVNSYLGEAIPEEKTVKYTINLNRDSKYLLDSLLKPARIILDIQK